MDGKDEVEIVKVHSFDGQTIWVDRQTVLYEVGNFLGGGAAGTVYECEHAKSREHYALKILNPLGYKLSSPTVLRRCTVLVKGKVAPEAVDKNKEGLSMDHIWWLLSDSTKQYIAAYYSQRNNALQEISLVQCCQIWGTSPESVGDDENGDRDLKTEIITPHGQKVVVPVVPPKFADFIRKRRRIFTEIKNMRKISNHVNVIRLEQVLELTQESKCTIFLVMELANGGELFDRIKIDCGTREGTAKIFFHQLLLGVRHCHNQGVCHRDLKPENLLLQDTVDHNAILKIADFGFSARFVMGNSIVDKGSSGAAAVEPTGNMDDWKNSSLHSAGSSSPAAFASSSSGSGGVTTPRMTQARGRDANLSANANLSLRVLKSVVGSPFYVAPEVLQAKGYDGQKADVWSLGVILYAMLAGNLPFEQELATCKRYKLFCKWVKDSSVKGSRFWSEPGVEYPDWLFTSKFSAFAKSLIVAMLNPDPEKRISVAEAMAHPLLQGVVSTEPVSRPSSPPPSASPFQQLQQQSGGVRVPADDEMRITPRAPIGSPVIHASPTLRTSPSAVPGVTSRSNPHSPQRSGSIDETSVSGVVLAVTEKLVVSDRPPSTPPVMPSLVVRAAAPKNVEVDDDMKVDSTDDMDTVEEGQKDGIADDDDDDQFLFESGDDGDKPAQRANVAAHTDLGASIHSQHSKFALDHSIASVRSEDSIPSPFFATTTTARSHTSSYSHSLQQQQQQQQQIQSLSSSLQAQQQYLYSISPSQEPVGSYIYSVHQAQHSGGHPAQQQQQHPVFVSHSLSSSAGASLSDIIQVSSPATYSAPVPVPVPASMTAPVPGLGQRSTSGRMSSFLCPPPPAPTGSLLHGPDIDDLIVNDDTDGALRVSSDVMDEHLSIRDLPHPQPLNISAVPATSSTGINAPTSAHRQQQRLTSPLPPVSSEGVISPYKANQGNGEKPPSFHDLVKRSTRFITAVPAFEVLEKVESVLEQYLFDKVETPIGHICKIEVHRKIYRLEVWGPDTLGPPLCALQLYQLPPSVDASPARYMSSTPSASESYGSSRKFPFSASDIDQLNYPLAQAQQPTLFLVEFIRGQLEIFAFKRFYQWVRQRLSELVKRDYAFKLFEQAASPMIDATFIQRYQQHNS